MCGRTFKSRSGLARLRCTAVRSLPVQDQPGARQCPNCQRWFKSAGGMAVHKCRGQPQSVAASSPPASESVITAQRCPITSLQCCKFHCSNCGRCFKSNPGFNRHNCSRGKTRETDRTSFAFSCSSCNRRFRRQCDLKRHKCRPEH